MAPTTTAPSHTTESVADRKINRELAEARQSGAVAPAVDVKTGAIINPHNPEFITKRPWYLGGGDEGPSLDHQADQRPDKERLPVSMRDADAFLAREREKQKEILQRKTFQVGMWVEARKNNKGPYRICQITKLSKKSNNTQEFDLKYEDGSVERKVKMKKSMFKPRIRITKKGARSVEIDPDVYGKESYDSKRDQFHGYNFDRHNQRMEDRFQQREALRKKTHGLQKEKKQENENKAKVSDSDSDSDKNHSDEEDEFVQRDEDALVHTSRLARQGGVGGAQMKVTARNLRIREDTAKYLRNLDPNSAYYDPKSRSMRDNPNPEITPEESQYAGDNFTRISGDAVGLADTQLFAWDASKKGIDELHPQANPSQAELLKKQFKSKSSTLKIQRKRAVLEKYGGTEYLDGDGGLATALKEDISTDVADKATAKMERETRFGVSTSQKEYNPDGSLVRGGTETERRVALKSKYEEDVFMNGHWTVWGSFFHKGAFQWGYADDHSLIKNSYCTGENGRIANDEAHLMRFGTGKAGSAALAQARAMLKAIPASERSAGGAAAMKPNDSKLYGEANSDVSLDKDKLAVALQKAKEENKKAGEDRKRKYNSLRTEEVDITEEDMEAYRLMKERKNDPMAQLGGDQLLEYK